MRNFCRFFVCVWGVFLLVGIAARLEAAVISLVKDQKYLVNVKLEGSEGQVNLEKNMLICFLQEKKKFACGVIVDVAPQMLTVKVKRNFNRLTEGMAVEFVAKKNPKKMVDTKDRTGDPSIGLRFYWTPYLVRMTRANYKILSYQGAEAKGTIDSRWEKQSSAVASDTGSMFLSFNGEVDIKAFNSRFGGSYKNYPVVTYKSYYDASQLDQFLEAENSGYAFSIYGDYVFYSLSDVLTLGVGLEAEISQIQLLGIKGSDNNADTEVLYDAESSRTITSLRLPVRYDFSFSKVKMVGSAKKSFLQNSGLSVGVTAAVPLASFGSTTVNVANDPANASKIVTPVEEDLKNNLSQTHSTFSFETNFGFYTFF